MKGGWRSGTELARTVLQSGGATRGAAMTQHKGVLLGAGPAPLGGPIWGYGKGGYGSGGYGTGPYGGGPPPPDVELVLQTVVVLGPKTTEGHIIQAVTIPWFEYVTAIQRDPSLMHRLGPRLWEGMLAAAYKAAGYGVILTPRSGDKGVDVIATLDDVVSIRIVDQMKAFAPGNLVLADDVRSLIGVLTTHPTASKAIITTTSDFAPGVYTDPEFQRLMPTRLDLRPGPKLIEWMSEIKGKRG
jgi:restriction system protein